MQLNNNSEGVNQTMTETNPNIDRPEKPSDEETRASIRANLGIILDSWPTEMLIRLESAAIDYAYSGLLSTGVRKGVASLGEKATIFDALIGSLQGVKDVLDIEGEGYTTEQGPRNIFSTLALRLAEAKASEEAAKAKATEAKATEAKATGESIDSLHSEMAGD